MMLSLCRVMCALAILSHSAEAADGSHAVLREWRLDPARGVSVSATRSLRALLVVEASSMQSPAIAIDGWNGDAVVSIDLAGQSSDRALIIEQSAAHGSTAARVSDGRIAHELFVRDDGSFEWCIVLASRPPANRFAYGLRSRNARFLYQGPLSARDIADGVYRPDSVMGSYAVYHASARNNIVLPNGGVNSYGTGKLCHIYRPRAWDTVGDTVWCDMYIDTLADTIAVVVPHAFLDSAVYPVVLDPTFGYTDVGASNITLSPGEASANIIDTYTATAADRIISYHFSCYTYNNLRTLGMVAYSMADGAPDERLAVPVTLTVQNASPAQWYTSATVSHAMSAGTTYCIAVGDMSGTNIRAQFDSDPSARHDDVSSGGVLAPSWTTTGTQDRRMSWYVTYETSAAPETTPLRRRRLGYH